MWGKNKTTNTIEFVALNKYGFEVSPKPFPASQAIPQWWKDATPYSVSKNNPDGKKLIIENSDDKPNYLYTPWIVDFDGLKFRTNSILFGQQIDEITNGQFFKEITRDKNYAIFKIADYMYRMKLIEK